MFETSRLIDCVFGVRCTILFKTNTIVSCMLGVTNIVDIMIAVVHFNNWHLDYFMVVFLLLFNNVFESNYIHAKSIFTAIVTMLNGLFGIVMIVRKYFISCISSVNCNSNCGRSYYKFICWHLSVFVHSPMTLLCFNKLELMIYCMIKVLQSNYRYRHNVYGPNKSPIEGNTEFYERTCCTSMNYAMLIIDVICRIYFCSLS